MSETTLPPLPTRYARLVKIEHTVFALPFAYVGAFLAVRGVPSAHDLFWITIAMVGVRSLAMALNRLIDAEIDAANPRTATREIPAGHLGVAAVVAFCVVSLLVFLVAVWQLDPVVRWLWPIPVAAFVVYPYLKRVTWLCHFWLGAVDGLAPVTRTVSPAATSRSTPRSAVRSPNRRTTRRQTTARSADGIDQHAGQEHQRDHAVHRQERQVDA